MSKTGKILAYKEKGNFILSALVEDKGKKLLLISEDNKKNNINPDKIELQLNSNIDIDKKDFEIAKELKSIKSNFENKASEISIEELYELLQDEDEGFDLKSLAELYFNNGEDVSNSIIMGLALEKDHIYFKLKSNLYYPRPLKNVQELKEEIERKRLNEQKKLEENQKALDWLKSFNEQNEDTSLDRPDVPIEVIKWLDPIRQYIIFRDETDKKKLALDQIEQLKKECNFKIDNPIDSMFRFFVKLGLFKEDENLSILRYQISINFNEKTLAELEQISDFQVENEPKRTNLTELYTVTIDDAETEDLDDALTLENTENGYRVGVHISDVSHFIEAGSSLDDEALNRGLTVYLLLDRISMFPEELSENLMSLKQDRIRPALSFMINFDQNYKMMDWEIILSAIRVDKKMTYEEVHEYIENENHPEHEFFNNLYNISLGLKNSREENGGIEFKNNEARVKMDDEGKLYLKSVQTQLNSDLIVKELMIISNHIAASFCQRNEIPAIYISQESPDDPIEMNETIMKSKHLMIEQLKKMKKSEMGIVPTKHFALGLDVYSQSTSPIRRYHDLIIHRQIKSHLLENQLFYEKDEIQKVAATAERASREVKTIERETNRYWILKYLKQEKKSNFKAKIVRKINNGYIVEIQDVFIQTALMTPAFLELDQEIDIQIDRVNPLLDVLTIKRKLN